jgi:hypothetical protein
MKNTSLLLLLLLASASFAQSVDITISQSQCNPSGDLIATLQNLPVCIAESLFTLLFNGLIAAVRAFIEATFSLILAVPDLNWFCSAYSSVMAIIESLYTILVMGLGLYYIVASTEVEGRIAAKKWLKNLFLMIIVLTFSFSIFKMILDVNQSIASTLLNQASTNFFSVNATLSDLVFGVVILLGYVTFALLTFATLLGRYLMIPFLLLLFPFAVFFYFLPISEAFGRFLLKLILLILFMTSLDALLILGFSTLFSSPDPTLTDSFLHAMASIAALSVVGLANLAIYIIALLMVVQQGFKFAGEVIAQAFRLAFLASLL